MAPKIFVTGATGYIGGTALHRIITTHPEYSITALVRTEEKASKLRAAYPNLKTVIGDLDSAEILTSEASKADIVLHTADCDHVPSATSLVSALSSQGRKTYLVHTSGTGILVDMSHPETWGNAPTAEEHFSDTSDLARITSFDEKTHVHRNVDAIVLSAPENVRTAIVCPPCIYGSGLGPGNLRSAQVPLLIKGTIERGKGLKIGEGKARWSNVHVQDLADVYLKLVDAAAEGDDGEKADWGSEGYYFAENGEHVWGELGELVVRKLKGKGLIQSEEVEKLGIEEARKVHPFGPFLWGTNSLGKSDRARQKLGWVPKGLALEDTLNDAIEVEAKALGKI